MDLASIISFTSGIVTIAEPVVSWITSKGNKPKKIKPDIPKAYREYKEELRYNCAFLVKIDLEKIDTKDITNPAIKDIASRLQTKAATFLLESIHALIQTPPKAIKVLKAKTLSKEEKAEAGKLIKTIISVLENTKELQSFTTLTEAEKKILKGFYARARLKHIKEKSLYIKQQLSKK